MIKKVCLNFLQKEIDLPSEKIEMLDFSPSLMKIKYWENSP